MCENKFKLNPDETQFIVFGAKYKYKWLSDSFPVNIVGNYLSPTDVVCNLGVLFDAKFCFTSHVNSVIKSCFISIRDLHHTRRFFSADTSVVIANALISSYLDYCNSLFAVCHPVMLAGSNMFKMLLHSLSPVHSHQIQPWDTSLATHQTMNYLHPSYWLPYFSCISTSPLIFYTISLLVQICREYKMFQPQKFVPPGSPLLCFHPLIKGPLQQQFLI